MTETERLFLVALKDALHPQNVFDLNADWGALLNIAKEQNIFPLVYDAATIYPSFASFEDSYPEYFAAATASMVLQMKKTDAFISLYKSFLKEGLSPITMKGIICRSLYGEKADLRPSGDEDILIEKGDYEKAKQIFEMCGYRKEGNPDKKLTVTQEVTFYCDELTVELHLNPFGTDSITREKMNYWFRNVFQYEETIMVKEVPVRTMAPTDHFLFLVFHAYKHFLFSGFGIRMVLDILLFAEKYGDRIDWKYVKKGVADVGATGFMTDLVEIGNIYLGFHFPQDNKPICPNELVDDMLNWGAFGNSTDAACTAGRIVSDTVQKGKENRNRWGSYFRLLFPTFKTWYTWNPRLKDRPWMIIPEWFRRIGRYLHGDTSSNNMKDLDTSYKIASNRIKLLKRYGVV